MVQVSGYLLSSLLAFLSLQARVEQTLSPDPQTQPATRPADGAAVLLLARSTDGLRFDDPGVPFLAGAGDADLVRLPDGQLLAAFAWRADEAGPPVLAVSRSRDHGRTWSAARPARLKDTDGKPVLARAGRLAVLGGGKVRLYFFCPAGRREAEPVQVMTALSANGLDYEVEGTVSLDLRRMRDPKLVLPPFDKQTHLWVSDAAEGAEGRAKREGLLHLVSGNGREFRRAHEVRLPAPGVVGSVAREERHFRAYVTTPEGVGSWLSGDGTEWKLEEGLRRPGGSDPAVVRAQDGSVVMLYASSVTPADPKARPLAAGSPREENAEPRPGGSEQPSGANRGETAAEAEWEPFHASDVADSTGGESGGPGGSGGTEWAHAGGTAGADAGAGAMVDPNDPFPPKPDFANPFDYFGWFKEQYPSEVAGNAYGLFDDLNAELSDEFNQMISDNMQGMMAPWDPAEHPDWDAAHQGMADALARFSEATLQPYYAEPVLLPAEVAAGDGPKMYNILLPMLGKNRNWVKATLTHAWRTENGKVSPEKITGAIETSLRSAALISQGPTLIHSLVSMAEQGLTQEVARNALHHNVFSTADEMSTVYEALSRADLPPVDPAEAMRGEYAGAMEMAQYVVTPSGPGGELQFNLERAAKIAPIMGYDSSSPEVAAEAAKIDVGAIQGAVDALDGFYREITEQFRTGYPQVRRADIEATQEKYMKASPLIQPIVPAFSRVNTIRARNEASRRATQLSYAVHIHKARTGNWPASLEDLPAEYGDTIRTDPFTGARFGYQVTESGPKIYSLGEDGADSGGVHAPRWGDDRKSPEDSDDFVFWPPQK